MQRSQRSISSIFLMFTERTRVFSLAGCSTFGDYDIIISDMIIYANLERPSKVSRVETNLDNEKLLRLGI